MIKAILFDKDGTLIEFKETWHQIMTNVFKRMEACEDVSVLKRVSGFLENDFKDDSIIKYLNTREIICKWKPYLKYLSSEDVLTIFESAAVHSEIHYKCLDKVESALTYLFNSNYILGIATADTTASTDYSLKKVGIKKYFSYIGTDDGKTTPKPSLEMFKQFCEKFDLRRDEIIIVGDSIIDYKFSEASEVEFVGIEDLNNVFDQSIVTVKTLEELIIIKGL